MHQRYVHGGCAEGPTQQHCDGAVRLQDLLRQQMRLAYRTGDQDRANKIMDRLRPDEQKEKLTQRMFEEGGQPLA